MERERGKLTVSEGNFKTTFVVDLRQISFKTMQMYSYVNGRLNGTHIFNLPHLHKGKKYLP